MSVNKVVKVDESLRRVVSIMGHEQRLTGVTSIDTTGEWTRFQTDQGYVLINPTNVLMYIVKGATL